MYDGVPTWPTLPELFLSKNDGFLQLITRNESSKRCALNWKNHPKFVAVAEYEKYLYGTDRTSTTAYTCLNYFYFSNFLFYLATCKITYPNLLTKPPQPTFSSLSSSSLFFSLFFFSFYF